MGMVYADITIQNNTDSENAGRGLIKTDEVRRVDVTAVVDTGAMNLVIPEELRLKLGLSVKKERMAHITYGQRVPCKETEAVEVQWKNRSTVVPAVVIPGAEAILLGAIPLEGMDLMVDPVHQELVGIHGDEIEFYALEVSSPTM